MMTQALADKYAECAEHIHTHAVYRRGLVNRIIAHWVETRDFLFTPMQSIDSLEYEEKFEEFNVTLKAKIDKMQDLLTELAETSHQTIIDDSKLVAATNEILMQAI